MARTTITQTTIIESLTGKEVAEDQVTRLVLALDEEAWDLDLSEDSLTKLRKVLEPFLKHEEPHPVKRGPVRQASKYPAGFLKAARQWGWEHGFEVSPRGLVPQAVIKGYEASLQEQGDAKPSEAQGQGEHYPSKEAAQAAVEAQAKPTPLQAVKEAQEAKAATK